MDPLGRFGTQYKPPLRCLYVGKFSVNEKNIDDMSTGQIISLQKNKK